MAFPADTADGRTVQIEEKTAAGTLISVDGEKFVQGVGKVTKLVSIAPAVVSEVVEAVGEVAEAVTEAVAEVGAEVEEGLAEIETAIQTGEATDEEPEAPQAA